MSTGHGDLSTSVKIQSSIGFSSGRGKHGPRTKTRRHEHRRRRSRSRDSSTVYSFNEGQLDNAHGVHKHHVHKLAARTSESDLCLQGVQSGQQTDISSTLFSDSSIGRSSYGYNYDDIQNGKDMGLSHIEHASDDRFRCEGFNRQPLEASEALVNKLRKQAFDIVDCEKSQNNLGRNGKEGRKLITDSAEPNSSLKLSEARVRSRSRNTCSAAGYSNKSKERKVTKWSTNFDDYERVRYKNESSRQEKTIDLMRRSKRTTESDSVNFDTKNRGDSDVFFAASNSDFVSYNESDLDCHGTYLGFGLKDQQSRRPRNSLVAEKKSLSFGLKPFGLGEHATEDIPKETQASRQLHENLRLLRKISGCYKYGEIPSADKNFSYAQNFGIAEDLTSNPALAKQRLWEQTIIEESTISADTSNCPYSNVEEKVTDQLIPPATRPVNLPKKRHSLNNSDKPVVVQMSRGGQNKVCNDWLIGDCKWNKHFRKCSAALQSAAAFSNNEKATDESASHGRWRANAYGTGSSLDTVTTSSEDEAVAPPFWTCTKWTDGNSEETLNESHESQWAYEVYSDTCQKPREHAHQGDIPNTCTQWCNKHEDNIPNTRTQSCNKHEDNIPNTRTQSCNKHEDNIPNTCTQSCNKHEDNIPNTRTQSCNKHEDNIPNTRTQWCNKHDDDIPNTRTQSCNKHEDNIPNTRTQWCNKHEDNIPNTRTQWYNKTPRCDPSDKHTTVSKRDHADVCKCAGLISSSPSERHRCPWKANLDSLFDDEMKVGKLPDFTDMSNDCSQSRIGAETTKYNDHAATIVNKFNIDYMQRTSEVNQETKGEAIVGLDTSSVEKDTSSHNAKGTRNCDKTCSKLESANNVKQSSGKCYQKVDDISALISKTLAIDNIGYDKCRSENMSPYQTASSVDEKLMKTVHSIKEDIEDVLQMLSSLDSRDRAKDVAVTLLNETFPAGKPLTVANVNCATDFVKQAFNKLISFKNAILMKTGEQDDDSGCSYYEYKKGREDYISDPNVSEEEYDIQNIFSYKNIPQTADAARAGLDYGTAQKSIPKHYSEKRKTGQTSAKSKPRSPRHNTSVFEKARFQKKGTPGGDMTPGGFDTDNGSVADMSPFTVSEKVGPTPPYKSHPAERPRKKAATHLKSRLKNSGKKHLEDSKQKEWRPVVSNMHGPSDLKHTGAGDRATLAFVSPNSNSRKGSPSPPTNKGDRYAYGNYPLPTFLVSPDNNTAESKRSKRQMKINVETCIPRRSSPEKQGSGSPKSKTSLTDLKHPKPDSRTPSKKPIGVKENVSVFDLKRKSSSRSADSGKKTASIFNHKSPTVSPKKEMKKAQKFKARSKGNNTMIESKPSWKAPRQAQDRNERNSPSSNSKSSPKVTGQGVSDTSPTVNVDTSVSRDGTPGTEMSVNRYMVVSEMTETSTPGDRTAEVQGGPTNPPVAAEPETVTPSPIRRSKRLGRRTRSRSRSKSGTKKRKKNKIFCQQRVSDTARFSSSDTSLFKKSNHLTKGKTIKGNVFHKQESPESLLRKPRTKGDKEPRSDSETQKSPLVGVSDIGVARSVKTKYRNRSATGQTIDVTEFYGNSSNATLETMAWPLANGYERAGLKRTLSSDRLFTIEARDQKAQNVDNTRVDMSTSELNISIKKLYEEITKLRLQLEASAEEALSRPMPTVDGEGHSKFARSYKVFTDSSPKFPEPVYKFRPDFSYKNMSQTFSQPADSQPNGTFSETSNMHARGENTPANYDRINEFMAILESRMKNIQSFDIKINNPILLPNVEGATENCADSRRNPASKGNNPSSCNLEASQSAIAARDISNWLNEDVYLTATCDATDNSDTQNDATEKFETAPSDNEFSSSNFKDAKPDVTTAECSSVNNNMRPTESGVCPEVVTVYQKTIEDEDNSPSRKHGKSIRFQNSSTRMYEVSSGDVDQPAECNQQHSNCVDSSEKKDPHCLVELCSETSKRFKVGSVHASVDSEANTRATSDRRSRGQCMARWENVVAAALGNTSQNKGSPACEQTSEKLYTQLHLTPGSSTDNPTSNYKDTDLDQTNDLPFFVKCVKGIFLGSTAAASVMGGSIPQSRVCPLKRKQSPTGPSANMYGNAPKDSAVPGSEVDEASVGGYIDARRGNRYHSSMHHPSTTLDSSPIMNNYLSKKQRIPEMSRSQSRTQLQEITTQNGVSILDTALGLNSGLQGGSQWTPKEVIVSCGINNKSTTLMQRNVPDKSQDAHRMESYSPVQTHIIETDKIMNHYSDAINAKSSQHFKSRPLSRINIATVSKNHDYISEKSNTGFPERDISSLKTYHRGNTKGTPQNTPNSNRVYSNDFSDDRSSSLDTSEFLPDKEDFRMSGNSPSADQNSIIASFETMMQQRKPYYVEHCGCREKKRETVPYNLDRSEDKSQQDEEFGGVKATFQVVTVANDNNSSIDLKCNTVMAHDFPNNQEEICADFGDDDDVDEDHTSSEKIVDSTVDLEKIATFCNNDDVFRNTDIPDVNSRGNHNQYKDADYWDDINDYEAEAEVDYGKTLLKPQASIIAGNGEEAKLPPVDIEITDCREYFVDGSSNEKDNLLLDTDEAESWYKTTEDESDIGNSMKKADDKTIIEETDVDENVEKEIDEEKDYIDYEQEMSDDDDEDDYDNNDCYEYDD